MKKIILTLLLLLLAAISTGAMAEWIRVEDELSYDSTSIRKAGNLVALVVRIEQADLVRFFEQEYDCNVPGKLRAIRMKRANDAEWEIRSNSEWVVRHDNSIWPTVCSKAATSSAPAYAEKTPSIPAANPADSSSAKSSAFLIASVAAIVGGLISYLVFKLLGGSVSGSTPVATGRRWMNWLLFSALAFATTKVVGALFSGFSDPGHHFAKAIIVVPFFAPIGFVCGWLFAKIRGPKEEPLTEEPQLPNDENEAPPRYLGKQSPQIADKAGPIREKAPSSPATHKYGPSEYPDFRPASAGSDALQASVYAAIANELESGGTDKGLWTRLFAEANGDEKMTKVAYIKQRAAKLMEAERTGSHTRERKKSVVPEKPPTNGDDEWQLAKQSADLADQLHLSIAEARAMVTLGIEKKGDRFILKDGRGYNTLVEAISSARRGNG